MSGEDQEDLEFNPFYRLLQTKFLSVYEDAQRDCHLVCVPKTSSLTGLNISRQFVDMHLLQPSILLRDLYLSVARGVEMKWQLVGRHLKTTDDSPVKLCVEVLSEELAYNKALQQFKIFIVSSPLDPEYKPQQTRAMPTAIQPMETAFECRQFLTSFDSTETLSELDSRVSTFYQHYLVVEVEPLLRDTAAKLKQMTQQTFSKFLQLNKRSVRLLDRRAKDAAWLSIQTYLLSAVHRKVFPAVCAVHKEEDQRFRDRCRSLRGCLTPQSLCVHPDYRCAYPITISRLERLEECGCPLEKLYCLLHAMDDMNRDVQNQFTHSLRHGAPEPWTSDDLVAVLAFIIVDSSSGCFLSDLYYMENFHWPCSEADRLSYVLVTFRAVVEFIKRQNHLSPKTEQQEVLNTDPLPAETISPTVLQTLNSLDKLEEPHTHYNTHGPPPRVQGTKPTEPSNTLGPFLAQLLESDDTVTSAHFYDQP